MLTETQKQEIDEIFKQYSSDKKTLMSKLEPYQNPDGSYSLYIRWRLDSIQRY